MSLARAALADPAVLVLDEATSNLDPGTEQAVELALERLTDNRTVVVVAHRLSTAARADRIGVVDGGALVELGTHDELVGRGGRYATLFESWSAAAHRPDLPPSRFGVAPDPYRYPERRQNRRSGIRTWG